MKPIDIYNSPVIEKPDMYVLAGRMGSEALPDVDTHLLPEKDPTGKFEIRKHWEFDVLDGRRFAELLSLWFDGAPVMVVYGGGREGDDVVGSYVTNVSIYPSMCAHLRVIIESDNDRPGYAEDEEIPGLDRIYNEKVVLGKRMSSEGELPPRPF